MSAQTVDGGCGGGCADDADERASAHGATILVDHGWLAAIWCEGEGATAAREECADTDDAAAAEPAAAPLLRERVRRAPMPI
jgi:hypothetical protein